LQTWFTMRRSSRFPGGSIGGLAALALLLAACTSAEQEAPPQGDDGAFPSRATRDSRDAREPVEEAAGSTAAPPTTAEACTADAAASCAALAKFYPDRFSLWYLDDAACRAMRFARCGLILSSPDTGWTPERRLACATAWSTATAADLSTIYPRKCDTPPGKRPENAPCSIDAECATRSCSVPVAAVCGVCKPRVQAAGACTFTS
jgi:hypothetical protein